MKKKLFALLLIGLFAFSNYALAAWAYKITKVEQRSSNPDTLTCTVDFTDGINTVTEEVPIFQPDSKQDVIQGIKNRAATIKQRVNRTTRIKDVIKPAVDQDINQPAPAEIVQ